MTDYKTLYQQQLAENNKWLQVARIASCDTPEQFQEYCGRTDKCVTVLTGEACALEEENKKIREEHEVFNEIWKTEGITEQDIIDMKRQISDQCDLIKDLRKKTPEGVMRAFAGIRSSWMEDEERYYSENYSEHTQKYDDKPSNIQTKYLDDCNYTHLRILDDWLSKRPGHLR